MADERDPKVSQRYRELRGEEPSRELDQAILSAARRSVEHPHAPLVTPSGRHRWYFSLGAAAVIVLAVAVTYQMQQEQPDPYATGGAPGVMKPAPKTGAPALPKAPAKPKPQPAQPAPVLAPEPPPQVQQAPRPEAATRAESAKEQSAVAPETRMRRDAAGARPAPRAMQAPATVDTPERMLERIVELRKEGNNEEAERLLAEFRRRYPDYRIPESVVRP